MSATADEEARSVSYEVLLDMKRQLLWMNKHGTSATAAMKRQRWRMTRYETSAMADEWIWDIGYGE